MPRLRAWALPLLGLVAACAVADTVPPRRAAPADPAQAMAQVQSLIGDAACRSDADCQTLGVGRRACGGPAQYLPWSAWRSSGKALTDAAAATLKAAPAGGEAMMGSCQVLMDPGAACQRTASPPPGAIGTCRLRTAQGPTAPR